MAATVQLTASEIANLWAQYMSDTAAICMNKHVLKVVEDTDTQKLFEQALQLSTTHVEIITNILKTEHLAVPIGFTHDDVNLESPRLFTDIFHLHYLHVMTTHGITAYGLAISTSTRKDIREHFIQSNHSTIDLYHKITDVLLSKGVYSRPSSIPYEKVEFVKEQSFLAGWFAERRPLHAVEINNIFFNLKASIMAEALFIGFSQVAKKEEVTDFLISLEKIVENHIEIFSSLLHKDNLTSPSRLDSGVTTSKVSPFSDKLMMFQTGYLLQSAIGYYGGGLATSMRTDLLAHYGVTIPRDLIKSEDWMNIMIKNGWLEQVPLAPDRNEIALEKK